jgi:hypothetical protein
MKKDVNNEVRFIRKDIFSKIDTIIGDELKSWNEIFIADRDLICRLEMRKIISNELIGIDSHFLNKKKGN